MTPQAPGFFCGLKKPQLMLKARLLALILIAVFILNGPGRTSDSVEAFDDIKNPEHAITEKIESQKMDQRAKILQAYLAKYNSPLQYQAQSFVEAADKYQLDWKLIPAIAGVESTFGKFIPGSYSQSSYNAWGWGVYGNQAIYFQSWRDGIFTVAEGLKTNYISRGLTDPDSINSIYSTSPAWSNHVTYFLDDLKKFETQYANEQTWDKADVISQIAGTSAQLALR
jgi:hypothetical protein